MKIDLKKFRKDHDLIQKDVAKMFNCEQSNISEIERNKKSLEDYQKDILIEMYGLGEVEKYIISDDLNNQEASEIDPGDSTIEIRSDVWEVIRRQAASLESKDKQLDRVISLLEKELGDNKKTTTLDNVSADDEGSVEKVG